MCAEKQHLNVIIEQIIRKVGERDRERKIETNCMINYEKRNTEKMRTRKIKRILKKETEKLLLINEINMKNQ